MGGHSVPCQCSCPALFPGEQEEWCYECRLEFDRWIDDQLKLRQLVDAYDRQATIQPASEHEWQAHLAEMAPTVEEWAL